MPSDIKASGKPKIVGLTGGIGSGKSTIAKTFGKLGAVVIDADAIAREILRSPEVAEKIRKNWGSQVFEGGVPDRARIADIAFQDQEKLRELIDWMHPPILKEMRAQLDRALEDKSTRLVIIDAPLLIEADIAQWCDTLLFVEADQAIRAARVRADRGWSDDELGRRESSQTPVEQKKKAANVILENNDTREHAGAFVSRLYEQWTSNDSANARSSIPKGEENG